MRIRSLVLALAFTFALTNAAEARKRPVPVKVQKARKANIKAYKATQRKIQKLKVKHK